MGFISNFPKKHQPLNEQIERFQGIYEAYFARLDAGGGARDAHVTILARSAASPACRMLIARAADCEKRGITVQAIFARLAPAEPLLDFIAALHRLNGAGNVAAALRWAQNPCLLDAHEQLTLGIRTCWTGDCMRRSADSRNALDLFEENSIGSVRLAELAFSAMWNACKTLPRELFDGQDAAGDPMPGAASETVTEKLVKPEHSAVVIKLRAKA